MASSTRRDPDALTRILDRQLNVITRQQALTAGMTKAPSFSSASVTSTAVA
jgi:hypothetical protein